MVATGSVVLIWLAARQPPPLEIVPPPETTVAGSIYVGGEVASPGHYPLQPDTAVTDLLNTAGGSSLPEGDYRLVLGAVATDNSTNPQLIDINRAEAWLLEALPGIGQTRAAAIVAYREEHGPFQSVSAITLVPGISRTVYEDILPYITIEDSSFRTTSGAADLP